MSREDRDQELFDVIAKKYMRKDLVPASSFSRKQQLLTALKPLLGEAKSLGTIVDIGCGIGAPAKYLDGHYLQYIGVDQSAEMVRVAELFNQSHSQASFVADSVKNTQLKKNTADMILSIGALHHMTELEIVMGNLVKIAKPDADFVVVEPQNANPIIQSMRWLRGKIDKGYSEEQIFFSEEELTNLFARHGVINLKISYQGYLSTPFAQVIIPPQFITLPLSRLSIRIDKWLQNHLKWGLEKLSFNIIITGKFKKEH